MIELEEIGRTYRRPSGEVVEALAGVSLRIERGDFLAIEGTSGSGKSTLLNILGLLDRVDRGRYRFAGEDVSELTVAEQAHFRNRKVGFVFQAFHLLPRTSAVENVELPLLYSDRAAIRGLGLRALQEVGLADRVRHTPAELSAGQQQRVAIARALVNEPDLLLADEPTGNLDPASAAEIMGILRRLNASGRTIVLVTHDPAIAAQARRRIRIEGGRITADESSQRAPTWTSPGLAGTPAAARNLDADPSPGLAGTPAARTPEAAS